MFPDAGSGLPYNRGRSPAATFLGGARAEVVLDAPVSLYRQTLLSTVFLRSEIPAKHPSAAILGEERLGAGVAVSPQQVLTAHYLIMGASSTTLSALDGRERRVKRAAVHHETGLALIAFDGPPLVPVRLRPEASPGMPVFIVSSTGERERKGATGHITAVAPFEAFWEYMLDRAIMTTAVNPGLAGAPLFDGAARLVGLVSLGLASVARYSLAIPVDLYLEYREEMEGALPRRARRAWVGIYPQGFDGGVVLTGVVPSGPAERAGLTRGDLLLSVDGQSVSSLRDLYQAIWRHEPGEALGVQILRDSAIRTVDVVAADRYDFYK